jgi:hypothetical protein
MLNSLTLRTPPDHLSIWSEAMPKIGTSHSAQGRRTLMIACKLHDRLKNLTDALIEENDLDAAWLAAVLVAAQDSIENSELGAFALRVWRANQVRQEQIAEMTPTREVANPEIQGPTQLRYLVVG